MRRLLTLSTLALLALAAPGLAGGFCLHCTTHCIEPPCDCPDCSCPCDHRLTLTLFGPEHAHKYIEELCAEDCCTRIKAVSTLGCRLHADFCCDPAVLDALIGSLLCDPCWEVRRAAARALYLQDARTDQGVLALYISARLDPHYMVRAGALEALDIITRCRSKCYDGLYKSADVLIAQLRKLNFKPGSPHCRVVFAEAYAGCTGEPMQPADTTPTTTAQAQAGSATPAVPSVQGLSPQERVPEGLPAPKPSEEREPEKIPAPKPSEERPR